MAILSGVKTYQLVERLQALGMPMDSYAVSRLPRGLIIQQLHGYYPTRIYDAQSGNTGLATEVRVTCDSSPMVIETVEIELAWTSVDSWVSAQRGDEWVYAFPERRGLRFPRRQVIHDQLKGPISKGRCLQGFIVGTGPGPIPPIFRGSDITGELVICDAFGNSFRKTLSIYVDPLREVPSRTLPSPQRQPIFAENYREADSDGEPPPRNDWNSD